MDKEFILEINIIRIMKKKKIPAQKVLDYMGWANNSVLYKKSNGQTKISILEAFKLSKILKEPIEKIFRLKISKLEKNEEV